MHVLHKVLNNSWVLVAKSFRAVIDDFLLARAKQFRNRRVAGIETKFVDVNFRWNVGVWLVFVVIRRLAAQLDLALKVVGSCYRIQLRVETCLNSALFHQMLSPISSNVRQSQLEQRVLHVLLIVVLVQLVARLVQILEEATHYLNLEN